MHEQSYFDSNCDVNNCYDLSANGFGNNSLFYTLNNFYDPRLGSTLSVSNSAISQFGLLGAATVLTLTDPGSTAFAFTDVQANFTDIITITPRELAGHPPGYLVVRVVVSGGSFASGTGRTFFGVGVSTDGGLTGQIISNQAGLLTITAPLSFGASGYEFNFSMLLAAFADVGGGDGVAAVLLGRTVTLTGLQVLDSQFNEIPDPVFTSASGTQYTVNGVVPEPKSGTLFLFGGLFLMAAIYCPRLFNELRRHGARQPHRCGLRLKPVCSFPARS